MNNEWKMVPAALLDRALLSIMENGIEVDGQYELLEIQKAPAPPAGDVEVIGYATRRDGRIGSWLHRSLIAATTFDATAINCKPGNSEIIELVDRADVTRLEERCGRLDYDYVTVQADLREMTAERDWLLTDLGSCSIMAAMIEERDWAEHAGTGPVSSKVEHAITQLHNNLHEAQSELTKARKLLNTPHTDEWFEGVRLEAGHQIGRWGADHDASKAPADWFWLIGYLAQKAMTAHMAGNEGKARHHTISTGAAMLNWFRAIVGDSNAMRPGHEHGICQKCNDTGEVDSGGVHPWGDAIKIPCDCQPATPAAHNVDESCGQDAEAAKGGA